MCVCVLCCVLFLKGEAYKLFWPEKAEFVRMAARYGVTIIPFASVGEDELLEVLFLILKISFTAFFFPPLKTWKKMKVVFFFWPETSHILPSSLWVWWFLDTHERESSFLLWGLFSFSNGGFLWQNYPTIGHLGVTSVNWYLVEDKILFIVFDWIFFLLWRTDFGGCKWNPEHSFSQESPDGKGCTSSAVTTIPLSFSLFLLLLQRFLQKEKKRKAKSLKLLLEGKNSNLLIY